MSSNKVNKTTGELVTLASGMRMWIGTKAAHDAAVQAGTMPNNCAVAIIDDYDEGYDTYSTEEVKTNKIWINGKPIYRQVYTGLDYGATTNAWSTIVGIDNNYFDTIVSIYGYRSSDGTKNNFAYQKNDAANRRLKYYTPLAIANCDILIVEYTKTTD